MGARGKFEELSGSTGSVSTTSVSRLTKCKTLKLELSGDGKLNFLLMKKVVAAKLLGKTTSSDTASCLGPIFGHDISMNNDKIYLVFMTNEKN